MSIYNNVTRPFVQFSTVTLKNEISENVLKYAKITAIVAAVLAAAAAVIYYIYNKYKIQEFALPPAPPTPPPAPRPILIDAGKESPKPAVPPAVINDILLRSPKGPKTNPDGKKGNDDQLKPDIRPQPQKQNEDDEWAIALQAAEDAEQAERDRLRRAKKPAPVVVPPQSPRFFFKAPPAPIQVAPQHPLPPKAPQQPAGGIAVVKDSSPTPVSAPVIEGPIQAAPRKKNQKVAEAPFSKIVDEVMHDVSENIFTSKHFSAKKAISRINSKQNRQILALLNELIEEFEKRHPQFYKITCGQSVPAYFAQVKDQSDETRKYYSLCGIRNMLQAGPGIIDDFAQQSFLGGTQHYGSMNGLNAFKFYTGTVVDLDTQLDDKVTTDQEALKQARELIVAFGKRCGLQGAHGGELTAEDVARQLPHRKLQLPQPYQGIHMSIDNLDRSNHAIWTRQQPTSLKLNYYVNVPNCDVILSATLRFPYMMAELVWRAKEANGGKMSDQFLDDFFSRGISDMCFNDKIRQFNAFHLDWMAKFDGSETPEETARNKVLSGAFGDDIKAIGPDKAIKDHFNRATLSNLISDFDIETNGRSLEEWVAQELDNIITKLKEKNVWEKTLYRSDEPSTPMEPNDFPDGSDFFLLDRNTLENFLKVYYNTFAKYM